MDGLAVVNGRFLRAKPTGLHRVGRGLLRAARSAGMALEVLAPAGVSDPLVDRCTLSLPGRPGDHLWEQVALPALAGRRPVLSVANTGPIRAHAGVVMLADLGPLVGPHWYSLAGRLYMRVAVAAARRARAVLVMCEQMGREVRQAGISDHVSVVRPALDAGIGPAPEAEVDRVRSRFGLTGPYLLHVGWADPRKGARTAIAAHLQVVPGIAHQLVLVGGTHRNFSAPPAATAPSVVRTGYVSDEDLLGLLTGAEALLFPSLYEGFGLPPLEAHACGTPALCSDIPSLRESTLGQARFIPPGEVSSWSAAIREVLTVGLQAPPPPAWSWSDAAEQLHDALVRAGCL